MTGGGGARRKRVLFNVLLYMGMNKIINPIILPIWGVEIYKICRGLRGFPVDFSWIFCRFSVDFPWIEAKSVDFPQNLSMENPQNR
jgi:hypothetical protein